MSLWGIVVAGGSGTRYGALKQLEPLGEARVLDLAVSALRRGAESVLEGVVVVVPDSVLDASSPDPRARPVTESLPGDVVIAGGDSRAASVRAGVAALPAGVDRVLVHDGARPLVPTEVVQRVVAGLDVAPAVVPVVPVTDSLRSMTGAAVDRSAFVAVQTPQGFHLAVLQRAHEEAADPSAPTDDASMVDAIGERVLHVDGHRSNMKITTPDDLIVAEALLGKRSTDRGPAGGVEQGEPHD